MGSCRLIKNPNGVGYTRESIQQLSALIVKGINRALQISNQGEDVTLLGLGIEDMLIEIGDTYNNTYLNQIVPIIEGFLSKKNIQHLIPKRGIFNTMSKEKRKLYKVDRKDLSSYTGNGDTVEEVKEVTKTFLSDTFGSLAEIKNEVNQKASNILINSFIIDRENGIIIQNESEINQKTKEQKQKLFKQVIDYLRKNNPELSDTLFKEGEYTYALEKSDFKAAIIELESILFSPNSVKQIEELNSQSHNSEEAKIKYDAAIAWFILKNFDNFVDSLLGESFNINPDYRGKFTSNDMYEYPKKGGNLITSWTTSDEIFLETRINKLCQTLINSTPELVEQSVNKTGKFIKFEDYSRIIIKIKDLALNPETSNIVFLRIGEYSEFLNSLSDKDFKLLEGKSLRWLINNIRTNPQRFTRLIMQALNYKPKLGSSIIEKLGFSKDEKQKCWSIYKGIFDPNHSESIRHIQGKTTYKSKNYYSALTQVADAMFSIEQLQYNEDEGNITIRSLKNLSADNVRREIESSILRGNTRRRIINFENSELKPWNVNILESTNVGGSKTLEGLNYRISLSENDILEISIDLANNIFYKINGKELLNPSEDLKAFDKSEQVLSFISHQLKIDFNYDKALKDYYLNNAGGSIHELLNLSTIVLLNKYISVVELEGIKGPSKTKEKLEEIFGPNSKINPGYDGLYNEMKLVPKHQIPTLERIATARTYTTGEIQSALVKNADGDYVSTQVLSRLLGALSSQFEEIRKFKEDQSIITLDQLKQIKRYKGLNIKFVSEIPTEKNTPVGMSVNRHTKTVYIVENLMREKFLNKSWLNPTIQSDGSQARPLNANQFKTFDEFITFCIEHEYQHILHPRQPNQKIGEYETMINEYALNSKNVFSPVSNFSILRPGFYKGFANIKDFKSILGNKSHTEFTVAEFVQGFFLTNFVGGFVNYTDYTGRGIIGNGTVGILPSVNSDKNTIGIGLFDLNDIVPYSNTEQRWIELSADSISEITRKELGSYYNKQWEQIVNIYYKLENFAQTQKEYQGLTIDFENNFIEFNKKCALLGKSSTEVLFELTKAYNLNHITNPIKLIEQIHYVKSGKEITVNNTIRSLRARYNDVSRYNAFMQLKKLDVLQSLVDENVSINLYPDTDAENAASYLRTKFENWIGKNGHNNGKMTLAKVIYNGKSYDITDKMDIKQLASDSGINLNKNLHNLRDLQVELHPMLEKWIAFNYLLSQEFLLSSVGSHVTHPSKVNHSSKIFSFKDATIPSELSDRFINLDDKITDFSDFKQWERAKQLAERQNKILITSYNFGEPNIPDSFIESYKNGLLQAELDILLDSEIKEEASRFLAQHKRNVSLTAAMHPFQLNQIDGIPSEYNMAVIDDIHYELYTVMGTTASQAPFDGATFVNPLVVYWENNSLNEDRAGVDKKQFIHYYDEATGTGGIIKTAGFGLTNDRIKNHEFYRTMVYNMMNRSWVNPDGSIHKVKEGGILKDFEGNSVDYGPIYFKKGSKYYLREIIKYDNDNETYIVNDTEVDIYGDIIGDSDKHTFSYEGDTTVNSNYKVWQMFGGFNSMELGENGKLIPSEQSLKLTAHAANIYGSIKEEAGGVVEDADDLIQPMKLSDIHYMPTVGAIKQGAANVNSASMFYNKGQLNHMRVKMRQSGIQLDKEHHADNSVLSLMTQVMSAAAAKGYTIDKSSKIYDALYKLTQIGTREFRDSLGNITSDPDQFDAAVSKIILDTILNSSPTDGDLMQNITKNLITEFRNNKQIKLNKEFADKIDSEVPYSNRGIYKKLITSLTSSLTKSGIKQDVSGILAVLNPTQDIIKLFKVPVLDSKGNIIPGKFKTCTFGQLENYFELYGIDPEQENPERALLQAIQNSQNLVYKAKRFIDEEVIEKQQGDISDIEIGKYYVIERNGVEEIVYVNMPHSLKNIETNTFDIHKKTKEGTPIYKYGYKDLKEDNTITSIKEYLLEGQDLKSYNVRFEGSYIDPDTKKEIKKSYQIADLDIVQDFFKLKSSKNSYNDSLTLLMSYGKFNILTDMINKDVETIWVNNLNNAKSTQEQNFAKLVLNVIKDFYNDPINFKSKSYKTKEETEFKELFIKYISNTAQKVLNREMQLALAAISPTGKKVIKVKINGKQVVIDKTTIKTQGYGCIMPKTFKSNLGLEQHDDLETIKNNPDFFVERLALKFTTKVNNYDYVDVNGQKKHIYNFHLELKRSDGNHIYVRQGFEGSQLSRKINIHKYVDHEGNVFRRDSKGNILHPLFSENDEVWLDAQGNEIIITSADTTIWKNSEGNNIAVIKGKNGKLTTTTGQEIQKSPNGLYINTATGEEIQKIEISGIQFYLDNMDYNSIYINEAVSDTEFSNILTHAVESKNTVANNIASKIQKLGSKEESLVDSIKKQRELSDKLGNYEELLKLDPNNDFYKFANNQITLLGRRMHTSFLKTLKIIAARIPAQNQQSFMAMEVEGYENPDINSAYVSTYQFYLQGSDLDIDAVSLQTFSLNANGLFVGHSPYYRLESEELQQASELLPFPSGQEIKLTESYDTISTLEEFSNGIDIHSNDDYTAENSLLSAIFKTDLTEKGLFNIFIKSNGEVKLSLNLNSVENLKKLKTLLEKKEIIKSGESFKREMKKWDYSFTDEQIESLDEQLINIVNKHNMFLSKVSVSQRTNIARNYLTQQTYDLIIDPINQQQAMSSVDAVTSEAKNLAKQSSKATVQDTFSPGNPVNQLQSISENMVGKDGIAVCATGLKTFFALTQLHNQTLNGDDSNKKDALLCDVKIGGKHYYGLANTFTDRLFTGEDQYEKTDISVSEQAEQDYLFSRKVKDYLIDQLRASDASNDFSALLSLSTDNAKELVLSKINAGTATIGMYLYGLSLGIPFDNLYKIINSELGKRLVELTKGDYFNNDSGTIDVIGALDYIMQEPTKYLNKFDDVDISGYNVLSPTQLILEGNSLIETINNNNKPNGVLSVKEYFDNLRNRIKEQTNIILNSSSNTRQQDAINYEIKCNQLIDFAIQYANDRSLMYDEYQTVYGKGKILDDFQTLAMGANEMKHIGKLLRLNQEIKTDPQELITQVSNIEETLIKRISQIKRYNKRNKEDFYPTNLSEKDKILYGNMIESDNFREEYKINFEKFVQSKSYAEDMIHKYDIIKASYNPLKILYEVVHYKGYMESLYIAYKGYKDKSIKFRLTIDQKSKIEQEYNIYDSKLKEQVGRNLENMADVYFRRKWMQTRYKPIILPASTDKQQIFAFIDGSQKAQPIKSERDIQLGTEMGDANFKLWIEEVVIPDLKLRFPNNKFIKDLRPIVNPKTVVGTIATSFGIPINMMPRSEYEIDLFNEYKKAFNDLIKEKDDLYSDAKGNKFPIQELLYLYGLITTNGKISPTSLFAIFSDYHEYGEPAISFTKAIISYDEDSSGKIMQELLNSYVIDDVLPFSTRYRGGSDRFKEFDKDTEEIVIYDIGGSESPYDDPSDYDPTENQSSGKKQKYTRTVSPYSVGFNTDYFLYASRSKNSQEINIVSEQYPNLSNYQIKFEELFDGTKKIINVKAKNNSNELFAEEIYKYLKKHYKGNIPQTIIVHTDGTKGEVNDLQRLNNISKSIEEKCLNV